LGLIFKFNSNSQQVAECNHIRTVSTDAAAFIKFICPLIASLVGFSHRPLASCAHTLTSCLLSSHSLDFSHTATASNQTGGLSDEVDEKILGDSFIPFGKLKDVQIPLDYETR
jgi:hypothetical protein